MSSVKSPLPSFPWREVTPQPIIGVDEVGRGCLAGPVYAAAVVLDETQNLDKLTDSKLLRPKVRETVAGEIHQYHQVGIGWASIEEIDQYNILNAALLAMKRAVLKLGLKGGHILVDGNKEIPDLENFVQTTVIKGDLRAAPISAASIVAKVARDQLMADFSEQYPGYGFEKHKGYSTKEHKFSIEQKGPCNIHRRSFSGVKEFL